MFNKEKEKLAEFQRKISYTFNNSELLRQALTTPLLGNQTFRSHYEVLETLGDAVIKTILISSKIKENSSGLDPEIITKTKQTLENNEKLAEIAHKYFQLHTYIFTARKQELLGKDKKIMADVLEAICGALFLDCGFDISLVEQKIISRFYSDWDELIKDSNIFNKNQLLEFLSQVYRITAKIECEYIKKGPDNDLIWIAKNPKIIDPNNSALLHDFSGLESLESKSKQKAEQDIYLKIYKKLKNRL